MIADPSHDLTLDTRYPVNPLDLSTDLFCTFSDQVIHLVIHLDTSVHSDIMEKAIERASLAEPIIRCRIIRDQDTLFWQIHSGWKSADHVHRLSSIHPEEDLYQALTYPLDPYEGNLFQVILIEPPDKSGCIIVVNVHHIVMDGRGLKDLGTLILQCYLECQSGKIPDVSVTPVKAREVSRIATLLEKIPPVDTSHSPFGWCSPISVPMQSLHGERYQYSQITFDQSRTAIIQKERRKWGITMNDLMIAVIARAIASELRMMSDITVPLYTTVDLRRYLPGIPERSLMNFSTSFEVGIPVKHAESLQDTAKRVHILMSRIKSRMPGVQEAIDAENLYDSGYSTAQGHINTAWNTILDAKRKTTIFSNTGVLHFELDNPGVLSVRNAYILPGFFHPPGFFFLLSTFADIITLSASYAVPAYDSTMVHRMFTSLDKDIPGYTGYPGSYKICAKNL